MYLRWTTRVGELGVAYLYVSRRFISMHAGQAEVHVKGGLGFHDL